ncbi:BTAD domain-containing putative transcriptional regulator [Amycolatopsis sp. PS_44_ISF1]|uniref:AfsR/SARP family transcriptional regulator n=1 Tax=Amycolatopsis sp. PS_44_ISF1 TaxID=2974917 RepID=UPI0028DFFE6E|nr:BTAD domain-containing putative transcriptional regulator [Amycolatopsis sp. PS_44_ISF1]MDT8912466.1 winged helix-turn-helix domain-containing protein [Amycolatopsis sp. PS_44_ISF1]
MRFQVLGPLTATVVADPPGAAVPLPSAAQPRRLLALLLARPNEFVGRATIVDELWPAGAPPSAAAIVQVTVSKLRKALSPGLASDDPGQRLRSGPRGYALAVGEGELDAAEFVALASAGLAAEDAGAKRGLLERALACWRGGAFCDVETGPLVEAHELWLEDRRRTVLAQLVELLLAGGDRRAVVHRLAPAVAAHPADERLAARLADALAGLGRRDSALDLLRRTRRALWDEAGVTPGPELEAVYRRVAGAEWTTAGPPAQLPAPAADFTGRAAELAEIGRRLRSPAPVVVHGAPGSGKSVLAVQAAWRSRRRFPDGQLFATLAAAEPHDVLAGFLRALGASAAELTAGGPGLTGLWRSHTADRRLLVVLKDARTEAQVRPLLPSGPGCAVLVTSRNSLAGLESARAVPVGPMSAADSRALLAAVAGPDRLAAETEAADVVATHCAGLPLAVRIAGLRLAARPHLRVAGLAARLADGHRALDELVAGDLSVRAVVLAMLHGRPPVEHELLRQLGGFGHPVPDWCAAVLLGCRAPEAAARLNPLVDAHLLTADEHDRYAVPRFVRLALARLPDRPGRSRTAPGPTREPGHGPDQAVAPAPPAREPVGPGRGAGSPATAEVGRSGPDRAAPDRAARNPDGPAIGEPDRGGPGHDGPTYVPGPDRGTDRAGSNGAGSGGAGSGGTGSNNARPNRTESSGVGSNRAGLNGAGSSGAGLNGAGSSGAGLNSVGSSGAGLNSAGSSGAGPSRTGSNGAGPHRGGSNGSGSSGVGWDGAGSSRVGSGGAGSGRSGPDRFGPDRFGSERAGSGAAAGRPSAGSGRGGLRRALEVVLAVSERVLSLLDNGFTPSGEPLAHPEPVVLRAAVADPHAWRDTETGLVAAAVRLAGVHGWPELAVRLSDACLALAGPPGLGGLAREVSVTGLAAARRLGDRPAEAGQLFALGSVHWQRGRSRPARVYFAMAARRFRALGDPRGTGAALVVLADIDADAGQAAFALEELREALDLLRECGDSRGQATAAAQFGALSEDLGDLRRAHESFEAALMLAEGCGHDQVAKRYADVLRRHGHPGRAADLLAGALDGAVRGRARHWEAHVLRSLGDLHTEAGEAGEGERCLSRSLALFEQIGHRHAAAYTHRSLAEALLARADREGAERHLRAAMGVFHELRDRRGAGYGLLSLGRLRAEAGADRAARRALVDAAGMFEGLGFPFWELRALRELNAVSSDSPGRDRAREVLTKIRI